MFNRVPVKLGGLAAACGWILVFFLSSAVLRQAEEGLAQGRRYKLHSFANSCRELLGLTGDWVLKVPDSSTLELRRATLEARDQALGIEYAAFLDQDGKFLSYSDASSSAAPDRDAEDPLRADHVSLPVFVGKVQVGTVLIGWSEKSVRGALRTLRFRLRLLGGLSAAVVFGLVFLAGRWALGPLGKVSEAARSVGAGKMGIGLASRRQDEVGELVRSFDAMLHDLRKFEKVRRTFGRDLSPEVYREVLKEGGAWNGERRSVTVLFADIRNFTHISERYPPEQVLRFLNDYFTRMVQVITSHDGLIDKFIGDAILAVFGAPLAAEEHALKSVKAALAMREDLNRYNAERRARSPAVEIIRIGIAISSGEAVVGSVGSPDRKEYTVIGDTVNLAARMEAFNKSFGTDILVSDGTHRLTASHFRYKSMGVVEIRGRDRPTEIYQLVGE